eukprot:Skav202867  [mRNA]  locus=scaffold3206:194362:198327:- [translate_table: standard]
MHDSLVIPEGDLLVHGGDISYEEGRSKDALVFAPWTTSAYIADQMGEKLGPERAKELCKGDGRAVASQNGSFQLETERQLVSIAVVAALR